MSEKNPYADPEYKTSASPWDDLNKPSVASSAADMPNPFADTRVDKSKSIWEEHSRNNNPIDALSASERTTIQMQGNFSQAESPFAMSATESSSRLDSFADRGRNKVNGKLTEMKDNIVDSIGNVPLAAVGAIDYARENLREGTGKLAEWSKNKAKELFSRGKEGIKTAYAESAARKADRIKARSERAEAREQRQTAKLEVSELPNPNVQENAEVATQDEKPAAEQVKKPSFNKLQMQDARAIDRASELVSVRQRELAELKKKEQEALKDTEEAVQKLVKLREEYNEIPVADRQSPQALHKEAAILEGRAELGEKEIVVKDIQEKMSQTNEKIGDIQKGAQEGADRIYERNIHAMARKAERQQARRELRRDFAESAKDRIGKLIDEDAPEALRKIGGLFKRGAAKVSNGLIRAKSAVEGAKAGWNSNLEPVSEKNQADYATAA